MIPERAAKLAGFAIWSGFAADAALFTAFELDIALLPKLGYEWICGDATQVNAGTNQKTTWPGRAGSVTGKLLHVVGERKTVLVYCSADGH